MRTTRRILPRLLACCCLCLLQPSAICVAQEVQWRYDYQAARHEAQEKGRPLLLDFGTDDCTWCRKLDATTFRDPTVAAVLNERFIPLKVDGNRDRLLARVLGVQSFPTLVLAASDGKLLGNYPGYLDVAQCQDLLLRVLATVGNPEWMTRDFQEATRARDEGRYARAVALLRTILEDGQDRPVQARSRQLLQELEQQAAQRLAFARQLDVRGQGHEATLAVLNLLQTFAGTRAAREGAEFLNVLAAKPENKAQVRQRRARELLARAREDYRSGRHLACLEHCEILTGNYGELPEGQDAAQLLDEIRHNPDWLRKACDRLADRLGWLYLDLAESCASRGQSQEAIRYFERVLQTVPETRQAEQARARLGQLR